MRAYTMHITVEGMCETHYYELKSPNRIRQEVVEQFRERFGHDPEFCWHKDGFMAEAWDTDGKEPRCGVTLEQQNLWCPFLGPLPIVRRGTWAIQKAEAA